MTDQELLTAIRQMIHEETAPIKDDITDIKRDLTSLKDEVSGIQKDLTSVKDEVGGIKVILDVDVNKNLNLLSEGHELILERLPDPAEVESLDARLFAVETVVRKNSKDIKDLKKAQ